MLCFWAMRAQDMIAAWPAHLTWTDSMAAGRSIKILVVGSGGGGGRRFLSIPRYTTGFQQRGGLCLIPERGRGQTILAGQSRIQHEFPVYGSR